MAAALPLGVLDLSPVAAGSQPGAALHNTIDLARLADRLGYARYWLAEHHNLPSIASSAPEIMIGQVAAATTRLRVGSGGVMLPNHAPLAVAERYKVLEALFPGRIDLGLGRAPGTDPVTAHALRARQGVGGDEDFLDRFRELLAFETGNFSDDHPFRTVKAMPSGVELPPIWLLGSSGYSAELAGLVGCGFAFAHHFADYEAVAAMQSYRARFRPSAGFPSPRAILGVHVVAAETEEEAERLAATVDLNFVRRSRGHYLPLASPEEAAAFAYSDTDRERIRYNRRRLFVGTPAAIRRRLDPLVAATAADEIMVTAMIFDHAARKRSYALLAQEYALEALPTAA